MTDTVRVFQNMIGRTMTRHGGGEEFTATDGSVFRFFHEQGCCEHVDIEEVIGDLDDLLGSAITMAEEVTNEPEPPCDAESFTWTFYKFATAKGFVTIRWLGQSNGYYGEGVSFKETLKAEAAQ